MRRSFILLTALLVLSTIGTATTVGQTPGSRDESCPVGSRAGNPPAATQRDPASPVFGYRVVREYPHDPAAFTQGLVYADGGLYEGTGLRGKSTLRRVVLQTGEILRMQTLDPDYFGEGIAVFGERIYQLTWRARTGFVYDRQTLEPLASFAYVTEGWGLTTDGTRLIMSDGTNRLFFRDPRTFEALDRVTVCDGDRPVANLNELEYIDGEVWANVWQTDRIARIDPATGRVRAWIDLAGLLPDSETAEPEAVLNGIAHDPATGRVFVTGKLWPTLFEIELVPPR